MACSINYGLKTVIWLELGLPQINVHSEVDNRAQWPNLWRSYSQCFEMLRACSPITCVKAELVRKHRGNCIYPLPQSVKRQGELTAASVGFSQWPFWENA